MCESIFFVIKQCEFDYESRMAVITLNNCLQLATTKITIDMQAVVSEKPGTLRARAKPLQ